MPFPHLLQIWWSCLDCCWVMVRTYFLNFYFNLNANLKVKVNLPQNARDLKLSVLHLGSEFGYHSLKGWWVMARLNSGLTHTHTLTEKDSCNDNTATCITIACTGQPHTLYQSQFHGSVSWIIKRHGLYGRIEYAEPHCLLLYKIRLFIKCNGANHITDNQDIMWDAPVCMTINSNSVCLIWKRSL